MEFEVKKLQPEQWSYLSEDAHLASFGEHRPATMNKIDFALLAVQEGDKGVLGYVTVRELDEHSIYWQFGGIMPPLKSGIHVLSVYQRFVAIAREKYERITALVENENISCLKLAMKLGFRINGVRLFKGIVLVEILLEFDKEKTYAI